MLPLSINTRFSFPFFCDGSFNFVLYRVYFSIVIIGIDILISTIILMLASIEFWLTRFYTVATFSVIYLNIISRTDLRFTIIILFIMAVICEVIIALIFLVLNTGLR